MGNRSTNDSGRCCCCGRRESRRIAPEVGDYSGYRILEIRPNRVLKVCHLNPRPRDDKFSREMQLASQSKHNSHPASTKKHLRQEILKTDSARRVKFDQPADVCLPNSINYKETRDNDARNIVRKSLPNPTVKNNSTHIRDDPFDRGHSASSVSLSLASATNYVPHLPKTSSIPEQQVDDSDTTTDNTSSEPTSPSLDRFKNRDMSGHAPNSSNMSKGSTMIHQPVSPLDNNAVLFFIHGVGGSSDTWCAQMDYFATLGYEIVAPDLIGHGFSQAPDTERAYHFEEISKDLEVIFDKFCKRRNILIAHSYGCSFASVLARRRSRRVNKIVLISGGSPTPLAPQPGVFSLPRCMLVCVRPCLDCGFQKSAFHREGKQQGPKEKAFDIPTYVLRHMMNGQVWPDGDPVFHNWLNVSALLIHGKHDKLVSYEEEKEMEEAIYGARLKVVDDASHMVMIEQPAKVNALIHEFLLADINSVGHPHAGDGDVGKSRTSLKSRQSKSLPHDLISSSLKLRDSLSE